MTTDNKNNVVQLFGANGQPVSAAQPEQPTRIINPFHQDEAYSQVSTRYRQVKTSDIAAALQDSGWEIVKTATQRVRDPQREGFQKHFVWMKPKGSDNQLTVGDTEMRLMISNSHDGRSAYHMRTGLERLVCSNGLMISVGDFEYIAIRHTADDIEEQAIDGALRIAAMAPEVDKMIKNMQTVELTRDQQIAFAQNVIKAVWPNKGEGVIQAAELLQIRRTADKGDNIWNVYNVIQENVIRGGMSAGVRRTRAINSPVRDVEVNREIFALAVDTMKKAA